MSHSKTEIRNAADMQEFLADPRGYRRVAVQGMDLQDYEEALSRLDLSGFWFLGCHLPPGLAEQAARQRAVVLPELDGFPFRPFRTTLYTVEELFDAAEHDDCLDSRIFRTVYKRGQRRVAKLDTVVARRIHDSSISEALRWLLEARAPKRKGRDRVAIMGSHNVPRRDPSYAQVARLGYRLTRRGFFVMTGGGPGLMEAGNLGAFLAPLGESQFETALAELQAGPGQSFRDPDWLPTARDLRARYREGAGESLGIPTWFYGHEPPNLFATYHAKYFENSQREEGLLAVAGGGVVFTEGNAGTVQEIFQDACQNYYRTYDDRANPMVLFGPGYWTDTRADGEGLPVYPLLLKLGMKSPERFAEKILLTGDVDKTVDFLERSS